MKRAYMNLRQSGTGGQTDKQREKEPEEKKKLQPKFNYRLCKLFATHSTVTDDIAVITSTHLITKVIFTLFHNAIKVW